MRKTLRSLRAESRTRSKPRASSRGSACRRNPRSSPSTSAPVTPCSPQPRRGTCSSPPRSIPDASDPTVLRSALYFASARESAFGVAATKALVANGFRGRLIRSIKRHLPSRAFTATRIAEKTMTIEELIASSAARHARARLPALRCRRHARRAGSPCALLQR